MSSHRDDELCACASCVIRNITDSLDANWESKEQQREDRQRHTASSFTTRVSPLPQTPDDFIALEDNVGNETANGPIVPGEHAHASIDPPLPNAAEAANSGPDHSFSSWQSVFSKDQHLQLPAPPPDPILYNKQDSHSTNIPQRRGKLPAKSQVPDPSQAAIGDPLPNRIVFWPGAGQTRENNLPYEMSLIEYGKLQRASSGGVAWNTSLQPLPHWVDGNNKQVTSNSTGNNMSWLAELPLNISRDVPAWQLLHWFRIAASQGYKLRQQDILDRMADPLGHSGLSSRIQSWQRGIGLLPQQLPTSSEWPSKQRMEAVSQLSYAQLKFNTWWDVRLIPDPAGSNKSVYIARQPRDHPAYRDKSSLLPAGTPFSAAHYVIEDPEYRQVSEQVKLLDDAMLFLAIKAEECGMSHGFDSIMTWIWEAVEDKWTEDLNVDLVCDFERWREGCPDTLSLDVLRSALEQAVSEAEVEAIKNGDYSLTPHLQGLVSGQASAKNNRRLRDAKARARISSKSQNKRKASNVDEVGTGNGKKSKRQAVVA